MLRADLESTCILLMCGPNVPCVVQGPVMSFVLEEHVFRSEGDIWYFAVVPDGFGRMKLHLLL